MLMVGTMIGAGYASGQEIAAFFGWAPGIFVPVFCGVLFFAFSVVLLMIGRRLKTDSLPEVHTALFGKAGGVVDIAMLFNAVIVLAAMMSGMDEAVFFLTGFRFPYGIAFGILSAVILRRSNGLLKANIVIVPLIIIFLTLTCVLAPLDFSFTVSFNMILSCFTYVSMNLLLSAGVLVRVNGLSKKQIIVSSLISSVIIAAIMVLISAALPGATSETMPLISVAKNGIVYYLFVISLIIAILTTLLSALSTLRSWTVVTFHNGDLGALGALVVAGVTALFGFEAVVGIFYPIIGVIGFVYIVFSVIFLVRSSMLDKKLLDKRNDTVHKRRQNAKNNGGGHDKIDLKHLPAVNDKVSKS